MIQLLVKATVSGLLIAIASEVARRSTLVGAVLISLPLASIIAIAWVYGETHDPQRVADLSWSILWVVLPSVVFFAALPLLIRAGWSVPAAMSGAAGLTAAAYPIWVLALRRAGVEL
jgi:hypothetical protein